MLEIGTRVGELEEDAVGGFAAVVDVGLEQFRERVGPFGNPGQFRSPLGATGDGDGSAVHVHFAVSHKVEPCPC